MNLKTLMDACPNLVLVHVGAPPAPAKKAYEVVDVQTRQVVGQYVDIHRTHAAADRKDAAYGAVRYIVRRIAE